MPSCGLPGAEGSEGRSAFHAFLTVRVAGQSEAATLVSDWAADQFVHEVELPEGGGRIAVPTADLNRIFLLLHIYRHFFEEGIGLRQLMDYGLLLAQGCTDEERRVAADLLEELHLGRFASGCMYLPGGVRAGGQLSLGATPEKEERFVLREVLRAGNFGQYNADIRRNGGKTAAYFLSKFTYRLRFLSAYPREILWGYVF